VSAEHQHRITRRQFVTGLSATALALLASGCLPKPPLAPPGFPTNEQLAKSELRVYNGQKLDSITQSIENSILGPQYIDIKKWSLTVDGLVDKPAVYTLDELLGKFETDRQVHNLECVEGWGENNLWEGVRVLDVLSASGVKPQAKTVIFHAHDGYTTEFPVGYFDRTHLLVYRLNGLPLSAQRGYPLRLGVWSKWGYKWCRWIERIELSSDANYLGYWESRGYSASGERTEFQ
jgi:DMSO/TMAO reductase YedYZ molybdopterin-dependent catalytic subunit